MPGRHDGDGDGVALQIWKCADSPTQAWKAPASTTGQVLDAGVAILAIASLSFLGFGAAPPAAEWGTLIADGRNYLVTSWWLSLLPGLFVAVLVLSLNHISKTFQELNR